MMLADQKGRKTESVIRCLDVVYYMVLMCVAMMMMIWNEIRTYMFGCNGI
jgi:hypothetical protein